MQLVTGLLKIHGEHHGENKDTSNLKMETPAVFATLPLSQLFEGIDILKNFIKSIIV